MRRLTKVMDKYLKKAAADWDKKKVLILVVSKEWFDMVVSGEKTEEYREIKPYWLNRITKDSYGDFSYVHTADGKIIDLTLGSNFHSRYTHVLFINGYRKDSPRIEKEIESITIGKPKKGLCPDKWLDTEFFIIKFK